MKINISQLLKEPVGSVRIFTINERITKKIGESFIITGEITLTHTDKGILASGMFNSKSPRTCSRCLEEFEYSGDFRLEEEFLPATDLNTGVSITLKDDIFKIDKYHNIDLNDAFYQYACMSVPLKLLCKNNCAGICPSCGTNLNISKCKCRNNIKDKRWANLTALRKEGKK
jgi:uncharacterized protein